MTLQECIAHTIEQRDFFASLPEKNINLDVVMRLNSEVFNEQMVAPNWYPLPTRHTLCTSVGCVKGWVQFNLETQQIPSTAEEYLGTVQFPTPAGNTLFYVSTQYRSQKEEGLDRYDLRISELRELEAHERNHSTIQ